MNNISFTLHEYFLRQIIYLQKYSIVFNRNTEIKSLSKKTIQFGVTLVKVLNHRSTC